MFLLQGCINSLALCHHTIWRASDRIPQNITSIHYISDITQVRHEEREVASRWKAWEVAHSSHGGR